MGNSRAWLQLFVTAGLALGFGRPAIAVPPDETPPSAPGSVTATANSGSQITVNWTQATDNKAVTGYTILRCQGGSCATIQTTGPSDRSFVNVGLASGVTYTYTVGAFDAAGNFGPGRSATATTPDVIAPTQPTNLSAVAVPGSQINLSWTASTDSGGVSGYGIERCSGAGCADFTLLSSTGSTSYTATGLASATPYSFRVRAYDAALNYSSYSGVATATSQDVTPPGAPSSFTASATASGTQIDLGWSATNDNVGVSGYLVERCAGAGCTNFVQIADTTSLSYSATGLTSSTSYTFRVRAYDAVPNYGNYSPLASAITPDVTPPTAPASLAATAASTTQINLNWPAATDNAGVSGYQIERCSGASCANFALIASTGSLTYSSTGLLPGTSYSFRVRAYDGVPFYGSYSPVASAQTQGSPAPPNETITYTYDALGRLVAVSRAGTVNNGEQAAYTYDASGNRTNVAVTAAP